MRTAVIKPCTIGRAEKNRHAVSEFARLPNCLWFFYYYLCQPPSMLVRYCIYGCEMITFLLQCIRDRAKSLPYCISSINYVLFAHSMMLVYSTCSVYRLFTIFFRDGHTWCGTLYSSAIQATLAWVGRCFHVYIMPFSAATLKAWYRGWGDHCSPTFVILTASNDQTWRTYVICQTHPTPTWSKVHNVLE